MKPGFRAQRDRHITFWIFATFGLLCTALAIWGAS